MTDWESKLRRLRATRYALFLVILTLVCTSAHCLARIKIDEGRENELIAAYVYNLTKVDYVKWPLHAFNPGDNFIKIGIIGNDKLSATMTGVFQGKKSNGKDLIVMSLDAADEIPDCHILFIDRTRANKFDEIIKSVGAQPVLTVSNTRQIVASGGAVALLRTDQHIDIEINVKAAQKSNLQISARLLRISNVKR